jgi:hypothetical protein
MGDRAADEAWRVVRQAMLAECDADIQALCVGCASMVEPLLLQIVRALKGLVSAEHRRQGDGSWRGHLRASGDATNFEQAGSRRE